jgi:hypothetical protein
MEAKMGRFFESVGNFFTGGDNIPWCDRDIIAVRTRELPFLPSMPLHPNPYGFYVWLRIPAAGWRGIRVESCPVLAA